MSVCLLFLVRASRRWCSLRLSMLRVDLHDSDHVTPRLALRLIYVETASSCDPNIGESPDTVAFLK